ncbi:hypothetical protein SOASR030_37490 [Leminorella grimontii]|uniref:Uncharacterized protein n=1 Tax=Leminorella grimontii TaxID=82981 RepID=A0AAV5N761_9GAMM|nr:hypothetical protein [Leminorella grimontii]KFC92471.1 hypothetical protein GLGR_3801 [Leminorella grimontii ATCC 33999 = DSM 5078]GKX57637.1 hypothetical protein SOASR030_37490 [Leminorella grimontii]VFS55869.1 Uncharacterised protein [Leminorella grimontii]
MKAESTNALGNKQMESTNWFFLREGYSDAVELPVPLSCPIGEAIGSAVTIHQPEHDELCYVGKLTTGHSYSGLIDADNIITSIREDLSCFLAAGSAQDECDLRMSQLAQLEELLADWLDERCPIKGLMFKEEVSFKVITPDTCNAIFVEVIPL